MYGLNFTNPSISSRFRDEGYVVKRSVFSVGEIETFRARVFDQFDVDEKLGLTHESVTSFTDLRLAKGCLLSKKNLFEILLDPRIIKFAQELLESEKVIYWGDSSYQIGTGARSFHRDSVHKVDFDGPDWKIPYSLIRIGLYLQDHSKHSGGLKVKPGTHVRADGSAVFVDTKPGDLVAWNLRLLHSGNAVKLKWFPFVSINYPRFENRVPSFLKKEQERERLSMFMTFSSESMHLYRYINEYQLKRKETIEALRASVWKREILALAEQRGLDVRVLLPEYQIADEETK
jgi:hypothetical protein